MSQTEVVRSLFVTLRRSTSGKNWFHRRIIEALGLSKPHECVEKPNNASIRGMLLKVPHLIIVETDRMKYLQKMRDYYQDLCRPPISIQHGPPKAKGSSAALPRLTEHVKSLHAEHLEAANQSSHADNWKLKRQNKHQKEYAVKERTIALSEEGPYGETIKKINARDIARKHALLQSKAESADT